MVGLGEYSEYVYQCIDDNALLSEITKYAIYATDVCFENNNHKFMKIEYVEDPDANLKFLRIMKNAVSCDSPFTEEYYLPFYFTQTNTPKQGYSYDLDLYISYQQTSSYTYESIINTMAKVYEKGSNCENGFVDFLIQPVGVNNFNCFANGINSYEIDCADPENPIITKFAGSIDCSTVTGETYTPQCEAYFGSTTGQVIEFGCSLEPEVKVLYSDPSKYSLIEIKKDSCQGESIFSLHTPINTKTSVITTQWNATTKKDDVIESCKMTLVAQKGRLEGVVDVQSPLGINCDNFNPENEENTISTFQLMDSQCEVSSGSSTKYQFGKYIYTKYSIQEEILPLNGIALIMYEETCSDDNIFSVQSMSEEYFSDFMIEVQLGGNCQPTSSSSLPTMFPDLNISSTYLHFDGCVNDKFTITIFADSSCTQSLMELNEFGCVQETPEYSSEYVCTEAPISEDPEVIGEEENIFAYFGLIGGIVGGTIAVLLLVLVVFVVIVVLSIVCLFAGKKKGNSETELNDATF